jgi:hypothetical protein
MWTWAQDPGMRIKADRRFHHNLVYTMQPLLLDAASTIELDHNTYWHTGSGAAGFRFDGKPYADFRAYQRGSGQDANSTWGPIQVSHGPRPEVLPGDVLASYRGTTVLLSVLDGLPESLSQLVVLRSMRTQYEGKGLGVAVGGTPAQEWQLDRIPVWSGGDFADRLGIQRVPATLLIDPQGRIVKRWDGYAAALQIAPVVARVLGIELVPGCPAERAIRSPTRAMDLSNSLPN